jgi:23S rRNA (cytidine1920-2'-O)/16S rRNA (cytidine1409-2'-O)-methyltransferase
MQKQRLDTTLTNRGLVTSRSQAESYIKLGLVMVNGQIITKPGFFVAENSKIILKQTEQYVSRAGLKLASVATKFKIDFKNKVVLDVGSSTGGFTDYALKHGAKKVIAVDVGTNQLHPTLHGNPKIELHEQTNILDVRRSMLDARYDQNTKHLTSNIHHLTSKLDIILIDVSFVSLRDILPHIAKNISTKNTLIIAMCKPQFESGDKFQHKGVVKNDSIRRKILLDFEVWLKGRFIIKQKADSEVKGAKGNLERFYKLQNKKISI